MSDAIATGEIKPVFLNGEPAAQSAFTIRFTGGLEQVAVGTDGNVYVTGGSVGDDPLSVTRKSDGVTVTDVVTVTPAPLVVSLGDAVPSLP